MSELGIIAAAGLAVVTTLIEIVRDDEDVRLPQAASIALTELVNQIESTLTKPPFYPEKRDHL